MSNPGKGFRMKAPVQKVATADVRTQEAAVIAAGREQAGINEPGLTALCLSGGGIRSASFCLGVMQALADARLLPRFDYLSTVSGGGYIGTWLQTLIHYRGIDSAMRELETPDPVADAAAGRAAPESLSTLRRYTNFLTPNPGFASLDLWTDIVLALRNILLNWLVFLPLLLFAVLGPILARTLVWAVQPAPADLLASTVQAVFLVIAGIAAAFATYWSALGLPNHRLDHTIEPPKGPISINPFSDTRITWLILAPYCVWLLLVPPALDIAPCRDLGERVPWVAVTYCAALMAGYMIAATVQTLRRDANRGLFWTNALAWLIACAVSAGMVWLGVVVIRAGMAMVVQDGNTLLVIVMPAWLAVSNAIHSAVFVGLRRDGRLFDLDREWLARLSALKLRAACLWSGLCFAAIGVSAMITYLNTAQHWAALTAPLATGPLVAWVGKKASNEAKTALAARFSLRTLTTEALLNLGGAIFMVALLAWLGLLVQQLVLGQAQIAVGHWFAIDWDKCKGLLLIGHCLALALLGVVILSVTQKVNVNRFSMHALYRNRLTRAFLGSAHGRQRTPEEFTRFDPNDNFPLSQLRTGSGLWPLFPVINMTLNLTSSGRSDWAERKAASFFATPLHCGSNALATPGPGHAGPGVFVPTGLYGGQETVEASHGHDGGMTAATAMTISGAAVSPSWGYHSSQLTAFLMTLFNMRLGAWLPNPAVVTDPRKLALARPERAVRSLLGELLGMTKGTDSSIYLTDGGHFENLGVYEMFRRRCQLIVVVDAGEDGTCLYEDLGNAIRKARIDLGTEVTFDAAPRIRARAKEPGAPPSIGFAVATVTYDDMPGVTAQLLYIKPSYLSDMPADSLSYALLNQAFPHESTLDQWFSESQFESYRRLGAYQTKRIMQGGPDVTTLEELFQRARANCEVKIA